MPAHRFIHLPGRFVIILAASLLPSCLLLENPLSDPESAKPDKRLFGAWKVIRGMGEEVKKPGFALLLIGKSEIRGAPPGVMKIVSSEMNKDNNIRTDGPWYGFLTTIGNSNYVNLIGFEGAGPNGVAPPSWDKRKSKGYALFKIKVEEDQLTLWWGDPKAAETAIRKGQLKGTVGEVGLLKISIPMLGGGESLVQYLADGGEKLLFPEKNRIELSRIK